MRRLLTNEQVVAGVAEELKATSKPMSEMDELRYDCELFRTRFVADVEMFGVVELDFNEILSLSLSYGETLLKLPSYYVYIDSLISYIRKDIDTKKVELSNLEDTIRTEFVRSSVEKGVKTTEASITSAINSNTLHITSEKALIELENKQRVLSGLLRGIDKFNSNLIELSRKTRRGLDTEE